MDESEKVVYIIRKSEIGIYAFAVENYEKKDYLSVLRDIVSEEILVFNTKREAIDFLYETFEEKEILEQQGRVKGKYYFS